MTTLKKRLARLRRRIWPLPPKLKPQKSPSPMPLEKAEALALKRLDAGLAALRPHPKRAKAQAYFRVGDHLLARNRLSDALRVNRLAVATLRRAKYYVQRATIYHAMGHMPEVVANAKIAHGIDPLDQKAVRLLAAFSPDSIVSTRTMERMVYGAADPAQIATRASIAMLRAQRPAEMKRALKRILDRVKLSPIQRDQIVYYLGLASQHSSHRVALKYYSTPGPKRSVWAEPKAIGVSQCLLALGKTQKARDALPNRQTYCAARLEVNLAMGRIGEAYSEYRLRSQAEFMARAFPNFLKEGPRQMLFAEGGPGDEIRFVSLLAESGATSATCEPRLRSLLARSFPTVNFIPVHRSRFEYRLPDYAERRTVPFLPLTTFLNDRAMTSARKADGVAGYMDILAPLRPDRKAFPGAPYLAADPLRIEEWREFLPTDRPNVALNWRSMLYSIHRSQHYLTAEQLAPLRSLNARFWLFQPGMRLSEYVLLRDMLGAEIPPLLDTKDDFEGQAAFLSCMDAVVAPFSTTAELAGALGVRTFMMAFTPNTQWRRNADGSDVWHGSGRVICGTTTTMATDISEALRESFAK